MFLKIFLLTNYIFLAVLLKEQYVSGMTIYNKNAKNNSNTNDVNYPSHKTTISRSMRMFDRVFTKKTAKLDSTNIKLRTERPKLETSIVKINQNSKAKELREGDILLPMLRNADPRVKKWPKSKNGDNKGLVVIPYTIESDFIAEHQTVIKNALSLFSKYTCIRYVPQTQRGPHIKFHNGRSCSASVGMSNTYRGQSVNLQIPECVSEGTVLHEVMHTLGFWHEQTRSDRDKYVRVNYENIEKEYHYVFRKKKLENLVIYDYGSIMHYGNLPFARKMFYKAMEVISDHKPKPQIGNTNRLSPYDIEEIKYLYKCEQGTYERCGNDFANQKAGSFQSQNYPSSYPKETHCTWNITVNSGRFVKVQFLNIDIFESPNCQNDAILIHDGANAGAPILQRLCGKHSNINVVTSGRSIFIIFSSTSNQENNKGFKAIFTETLSHGIATAQMSSQLTNALLPTDAIISNLQCNFNNDMCGMYEDKSEELNWIRKKGPSLWHHYTGPSADKNGNGYYLMADSSEEGRIRGDVGIVRTPWFALHRSFYVKFDYHMFGRSMGALGFYAYEKKYDQSVIEIFLFQKEGNQGNFWNTKEISYMPQENTQFVHFYWKSHRDGWRSNIALDNILISTSDNYLL